MMPKPIKTQRNKFSTSDKLISQQDDARRNHPCSDDEKWDEEDDSQIFENMKELSCHYESEDSDELESRLQNQQLEIRDYSSFSPMIEKRNC